MNLLLGPHDPQAPPKTTPAGITYYAYGLDEYSEKRINKKAVGRMVKANVEPWLIEEFREWALRLPTELAGWIDTAYFDRLTAWRACTGSKLPNGTTISENVLDRVTPQSFKVIFHPEPFAVPQGITAGYSQDDRVEVVIAYLGSYEGKVNTWLRKCDDLLQWEIGNLIGIRHGFRPQDPAQEIGSRSPCAM